MFTFHHGLRLWSIEGTTKSWEWSKAGGSREHLGVAAETRAMVGEDGIRPSSGGVGDSDHARSGNSVRVGGWAFQHEQAENRLWRP